MGRQVGPAARELIDGVKLREVRNVYGRRGGKLTELFRRDWRLDDGDVEQVFQVVLAPGEISGWHVHQRATDRLFVNWGAAKVVVYDARRTSPSHGKVNEFCVGSGRPTLIRVPPGVWHAVQNINDGPSGVINVVDNAYQYDDPDHWRLPLDTDKIPYEFAVPERARRS